MKLYEDVQLVVHDSIVIVTESDFDSSSVHKVSSKREITPTILKYLIDKREVVYVPKGTRSIRSVIGKAREHHLDLVTKNLSNTRNKSHKEYTLKLQDDYPIYFGPNNKVLRHLLLMSSSIEDIEKIFNESYLFLTRIHCDWL